MSEDISVRSSLRTWRSPSDAPPRTRLEDVSAEELEQRLRSTYETYYSELHERLSRTQR
jgi:hypothetical protein